jgi:hypothetical protein
MSGIFINAKERSDHVMEKTVRRAGREWYIFQREM